MSVVDAVAQRSRYRSELDARVDGLHLDRIGGDVERNGLLALCRILFGGFRGHAGWHGRNHWGHGRWSAMTPEEREQFRRGNP